MTISETSHVAVTKKRSGTDRVNYTNIGLMIASGVAALFYPFELFLFSYAVLGPLHYLTEISWLHDRKYFLPHKNDYLPLVGMTALITALALGPFHAEGTGLPSFLIFLGFAMAGAFTLAKDKANRALFLGVAVMLFLLLSRGSLMAILFSLLVQTLIHVFLFTGMFILSGTLKGKSTSGILSLAVFVGISVILLAWHPAWAVVGTPGHYVRSAYGEVDNQGLVKGFVAVNYYLSSLLGLGLRPVMPTDVQAPVAVVNDFLYENPIARAVMAFIAYAYTYHYLNWFSKTSVIKWHKVPRPRLVVILVIWGASLALYASNYQTGFKWLFFLGFLHVMLEFPLNHITFVDIIKRLKRPASA